ncbi:MAG: hypothetical protein K2X03_21095 [Bryobacteraceae bacterium]|nr:hypothetical protein [Bryobacteraceae bacterium]
MTAAVRWQTYAFFFAAFAAMVVASHVQFLDLPYFWDELGQYIPASLDLYQHGAWIPTSTRPNVHPPGLMAVLAGAWAATGGPTILVTRLVMLLFASGLALVSFMLAIELTQGLSGTPGFPAIVLLLVSPIFYMQAAMAHLDLPAALFSLLALYWFLKERIPAAALACTAAVLMKETAIVFPLVMAAFLWREKRQREMVWFAIPALALGAWLLVLARATGHWLGNAEFSAYNLGYNLHPVRFGVALLRRLYTLLLADFHWLGTAAMLTAWWRREVFAGRAWALAATLVGANVLAVSVLGGAVLERYLLPVLPLFYIAVAAGWSRWPRWPRWTSQAAMTVGLAAGLYVQPPYPYPLENSLAMIDQIRLYQLAAGVVNGLKPELAVGTAWPLSDALRRPEFGYVRRGRQIVECPDFRVKSVLAMPRPDVFVLYSRTLNPENSWLRVPVVRKLWERFYGYELELEPLGAQKFFGGPSLVRWERPPAWGAPTGGQWLEIYLNRSARIY